MLSRLEIHNLRGVRSLKLDDVGLVNIIVGPNNAGKTTVLEAIRLIVSGDPAALRRRSRSMVERRVRSLKEQFLYAFLENQAGNVISVSGTLNDLDFDATIKIQSARSRSEQPVLLEDPEVDPVDDVIDSLLQHGEELVVKVVQKAPSRTAGQPTVIITVPLADSGRPVDWHGKRKFSGGAFPDLPRTVWLGTERNASWAHASRYSTLVRLGLHERLVAVLRHFEPRLKALIVLTEPGSSAAMRPVLEVDLGDLIRLPLESLGDGFSSALSIISAIATTPAGLCLVDEIENGIYHDGQEDVWRAVYDMAKRGQTQVWATTHSLECIRAAYDAFREAGSEELRVHRIERGETETTCTTLAWSDLTSAFKFGMEVR